MPYRTSYRTYYTADSVPPGVKWLLISNIVLFLVYSLIPPVADHMLLLLLTPYLVVKKYFLWQLVTYMFLHAGLSHIFFNMLGLYFAGAMLEQNWGTRRFLKFYFLCGISAGLCDVAANAFMRHWNTHTLGASGAIYGLLMAFGLLYPDAPVILYFVPIKAKYLVMILGAVAFYGALQVNSGVSDIAHLGGMAFGYIYLRGRSIRLDFGYLQREYSAWKLRRAKKRFQVYLRKHGSDRDTFVN